MNEFLAFVAFLGRVVAFILARCVDLVCLCLFLASFAAPWRIPFSLLAMISEGGDDFRGTAVFQFFVSLGDLFAVPMGVVSLAAFWRWVPFARALAKAEHRETNEMRYNWRRRIVSVGNFFVLLADLVAIPLGLVALVSLLHTHDMVRALARFPKMAEDSEIHVKWEMRESAVFFFVLTLCDILIVPAFVIVLLSWRGPGMIRRLGSGGGGADDGGRAGFSNTSGLVRVRKVVLLELVGWVLDLPFVAMALVNFVTLWRARLTWEAVRDGSLSDGERRQAVLYQFVRVLADLPFAALLLVLVASLWRAARALARVAALFAPPPSTSSLVPGTALVSARVDVHQGSGEIDLTVEFAKPADLVLSRPRSLRLVVAGRSFWAGLAGSEGSAASSLAASLLPLGLVPAYVTAEACAAAAAAGQQTGTLRVRFPRKASPRTVAKKLHALSRFMVRNADADDLAAYGGRGSDRFAVQVEHGGVALVAMAVSARELANAVAAGGGDLTGDRDHSHTVARGLVASEAAERSVPPQDRFWLAVGVEFVDFLADVLHLVLAALTVLAPWRLAAMVFLLLEPPAQFARRVRGKVCQMSPMLDVLHAQYAAAFAAESERLLRVRVEEPFERPAAGGRLRLPREYEEAAEADEPWDAVAAVAKLCEGGGGPLWEDALKAFARAARSLEKALAGGAEARPAEPADQAAAFRLGEGAMLLLAQEAPDAGVDVQAGNAAPGAAEAAAQAAAAPDWLTAADLVRRQTRLLAWRQYLLALSLAVTQNWAAAVPRAEWWRPFGLAERDAALAKVRAAEREAAERSCQNAALVAAKGRELAAAASAGWSCSPAALWKRSAAEHRAIVRSSFVGAVLDVGAVVAAVVLLLTVYRARRAFSAARRATVWEWRRLALVGELAELALDAVAAFEALLVFATLYRALDLMLALRPSMTAPAARRAVRRLSSRLLGDLWEAVRFLLSWRSFKYAVSTAVWGLVVPAANLSHLLEASCPALPAWPRRRLAGLLWACALAFPFACVYALVPALAVDGTRLGDLPGGAGLGPASARLFSASGERRVRAAVGGYVGALLLLAVGSLVASAGAPGGAVRRPSSRVRLTWPNAVALVTVALDAAQLCSVAWAALEFSSVADAAERVDASPLGERFERASERLLLYRPNTFDAVFGAAVAAAALWYLLSSLPTVVERLLRWRPVGSVSSGSPAWRSAMTLLGSTSYVTVTFSLFKALQCEYVEVPGSGGLRVGLLHPDLERACWDPSGVHPAMASVALFFSALYVANAHFFHTATGADGGGADDEDERLDVKYPRAYALAMDTAKLGCTAAVLMFASEPYAVLSVLMSLGAFQFAATAGYRHLSGGAPACCVEWVAALRAAAGLALSWSAASAMVELRRREQGKGGSLEGTDAGTMALIGLLVIGALAAARVAQLRAREGRRAAEEAASSFAGGDDGQGGGLAGAERRLRAAAAAAEAREGATLPWVWTPDAKKAWERQAARTPGALVGMATALERALSVRVLRRTFVRHRLVWRCAAEWGTESGRVEVLLGALRAEAADGDDKEGAQQKEALVRVDLAAHAVGNHPSLPHTVASAALVADCLSAAVRAGGAGDQPPPFALANCLDTRAAAACWSEPARKAGGLGYVSAAWAAVGGASAGAGALADNPALLEGPPPAGTAPVEVYSARAGATLRFEPRGAGGVLQPVGGAAVGVDYPNAPWNAAESAPAADEAEAAATAEVAAAASACASAGDEIWDQDSPGAEEPAEEEKAPGGAGDIELEVRDDVVDDEREEMRLERTDSAE